MRHCDLFRFAEPAIEARFLSDEEKNWIQTGLENEAKAKQIAKPIAHCKR